MWEWGRIHVYVEQRPHYSVLFKTTACESLSSNKANLIHLQRSTSVILKLQCASQSPGGLLKYRLLGPTPQVSDSTGLGCGPGICISNMFPSDFDAAGPGPPFRNHFIYMRLLDYIMF